MSWAWDPVGRMPVTCSCGWHGDSVGEFLVHVEVDHPS